MPAVKRIDHVAIVVDDIEAALRFWRDALGLQLTHVEDVPEQQAVVAFLPTGEAEVELVKPTDEESGIARYLGKRGPGVHHICFEVEDLEQQLQELHANGIRLINPEPVVGTGGKRIAFVHPESTHGVLVELYELTPLEPAIRLARARALADRALAQGQVMAAGVLGFLRGLRQQGDGHEKGGSRHDGAANR
ncbi:MAG TPA: methylmalonyl-CoA epimerase [Anaerolineales bacterium]|nr:methylmalonyl-CoA epimerase [Anaerolineales bacterium]